MEEFMECTVSFVITIKKYIYLNIWHIQILCHNNFSNITANCKYTSSGLKMAATYCIHKLKKNALFKCK